jgi:hypothetical protein
MHINLPELPADFKNYTKPQLELYGKQHLDDVGGHLFYPFGGPDVTFPLLMFPNINKITLVGLEPINHSLSTPITTLTRHEKDMINLLYLRSFFVTEEMTDNSANIPVIITEQINNIGGTIKKIDYDNKKLSIDLEFNGRDMSILYLQHNLSNSLIDTNLLSGNGVIDATMFKAASYIPHSPLLSKFRNYVLDNSNVIVQDSTGIPFDEIDQEKNDIELFGQYNGPYKFDGFEQNKFKEYSKKINNPPLSFCYGYGCRDKKSMSARANILKIKKKPTTY